MKNNYRNGDLLIKQIDELPKNIKKIDGGTLAFGEVTGHHHTIVADRETLQLYEDEQGRKYFMLKKSAPLTHQEHKTITIEKGLYLVENEREFDPFKDEIRKVWD